MNYREAECEVRQQEERGLRRNILVFALFLFYLLGAHLRISIYSGESILLPMYPMLLSAGGLAILFFSPLFRHIGGLLLLLFFFILTQPMLTLAPESFSVNTFLGSLQLLVSVTSALVMIYALSTVDSSNLRKLLILVWCVLIVLAIVESAGLKKIFDELRDVIYANSGRFVYVAENRDLEIYGRVRTTVLASEPSFLADTLSALILMIFFLDPKRGNYESWGKLGGMVIVSFALSPSFKMLFYLLALAVWQFWPSSRGRVLVLLGGLSLGGFLLLIFFGEAAAFIQQIIGSHLESGSFYGRIGVAPSVAWEALSEYPVYGYGVGNDSGVYPVIADIWYASGAFHLFPWYWHFPATDLMSNGFWWQWVYLGLLGGGCFTIFIVGLLHRVGVVKPFRTIVSVWIVWYAGFAFVDPHSWYMVVVFSTGAIKYRGCD